MAMVLDALVSAVTNKLVDAGIKKIASMLGVNSEMGALQRNMKNIRRVLVDAESKKIESESINHWIAELREVLYDAEDLLDDFADAQLDKSKSGMDTILFIPGLSEINEAEIENKQISTNIANINSNLSRITSETPTLQPLASQPNAQRKLSRYNSSRITDTCSKQLDSDIVGIDDDVADLVDRITGDSNGAHSLFAITGLGGIGKTTLARKVFNHHLIQNHFDNTVWVCVSSNCTGEYLLKKIVRSIDKNYSESRDSLDELSSEVIEVVKEKRVFIVLDDIWDSHVWEKFLRVPLYAAAKHSRILITTRNQQIAMKMKIGHTHRMPKMNLSDGWSMLCKIVFEEDDNGDMNELEKVGKEIVDRCKGLPLAIKVVGGVLRMTDRTKAAWREVLSSKTWSMQDLPEDILASLLLSYEDLPTHLKRCFIYCSLFPQDFKFLQTKLFYMWIAEGFIQKEEGTRMEKFAKEYYNELVMRNLLQVTLDRDGNSICKMHDFLHSIAIFVSQNQYIYVDSKTFGSSGLMRHRHLRFNVENMNVVAEQIIGQEYVRTLMLSTNTLIKTIPHELLSGLRRLRVLDVEGIIIRRLPDSVGNMRQLRFLSISSSKFISLPDSIEELKNLETLIVSLLESRSLPQGIGKLDNLRHLLVSDRLQNMPNGLDNLKKLRVLDCFVVNDYKPNMKELKDLSELTDLSIYNLERVASKEDAKEAAIEKKTNLKSLKLHCQPPPISDEDIKKIEEVFGGIEIPENLTELSIDGFFGKQFPDHMIGSRLRQVNSLKLERCESLEQLPSLGDMPKLETLHIANLSVANFGSNFVGELKFPKLQDFHLMEMKELVNMFDVEIGAFPCLVNLFISGCPKLESLGQGLQHATCLRKMTVRDVNKLESIENLSSISELEISRNSSLRSVKNLPSLKKMDINKCFALEVVKDVRELSSLSISHAEMSLPIWLKNTIASEKWHRTVTDSEELVLISTSKRVEVKINGVKVDRNYPDACPATKNTIQSSLDRERNVFVMFFVLEKLIEIVMEKLVHEGIKKIASMLGVNSEMEALQMNMVNIRLVLVDAESKKIESNSVALWLAELREVLYDAEDLLDDFADAQLGKSKSGKVIILYIPGLSQINEACEKNISTKIENIDSNLSRITSKTPTLQPLASQPNADRELSRYNSSRITDTYSFQLGSETVDINDDVIDLVDQIIRESNRAHSLFAITGMGGIGKTTLAGPSKSVKDVLPSILDLSKIGEAILRNINSNFSRLTSETSILQLLSSLPHADKRVSSYNSSRISDTCSKQLDSDIVGIDDDVADLIDRITGEIHRAHFLFAITGVDGIGKTTLARKVFNHDLIRNHFDNNIVWVCVSSNRSGEDLLKEIIRSIEKKDYSESPVSLNELFPKLIEVVREKRFFIVLDDIWDIYVWEKFLRIPLHTGANYSRILITTRNQQVAMKMNAGYTHRMTEMNLSDGWSMLRKIVFEEEDSGDMNEFVDVGKEIVDRCKGLPLAIKVVGGVLRMTDRTIAAWSEVLSSRTWSIQDLPEDLLPSLLLSYEDLPSHLKRCFIYCSLFPKDFTFHPTKLLYMWIAEGFIHKEGGTSMEESAKEYYNELVMRNLLQVTLDRDGNSICKMHDLLHSLAIFVSQNQYIYVDPKTFRSSGLIRLRHLRFNVENMNIDPEETIGQEYVRTLMLSTNSKIEEIPDKLLSGLRRLRVLDVEGKSLERLPKSVGNMRQLRFLSISSSKFTSLPDSIEKLKNLETLIVSVLESHSLPQGIGKLVNLRHLLVRDCHGLQNMPNGLDNLKKLRVLDCFAVNDYKPNMKELKDLSELTDLCIYNLERVASKNEAEEAAIEKKTSLKCLKLHCEQKPRRSDEDIRKIEEVFAGIEIPESLTELSIDGFFGKQLPARMGWSRLHQVKSLKLERCESLEQLPSLGDMPKLETLHIANLYAVAKLDSEFVGTLKFPKLQDLYLVGMYNLEMMFDAEIGAFPCLVNLLISGCPNLESLGEGLQHATCLKKMTVIHVSKLESIENLSSISELKISWNPSLRSVKNLPSLKKMDIEKCPALRVVKDVGEQSSLSISSDAEMITQPTWSTKFKGKKKYVGENRS